MNFDLAVKLLLLFIAVSLGAIAVHLYIAPPAVQAQSGAPGPLYVEPGTFMLRAPDGSRSVLGKIMVDLRTGNVWGFPTLQQDPYPAPGIDTNKPVSHPFLVGKFALADMNKQ